MANSSSVERGVQAVISAHKQREGGGFVVRRPVGGKIDHVGPFLMLDHLGPTEYGPGEAVGAPDHPHRGFVTITYVLSGGFYHKDSQGNDGTLGPGWAQYMRAASGVVHSEMPSDELLEKGGTMEGFQLWLNLEKAKKWLPPRYHDVPPESIPTAESEDGKVRARVLMGTAMGAEGPVKPDTPMVFWDVRIEAGAAFRSPVPAGFEGFVYIYRGRGAIGDHTLREGQMAHLETEGDEVRLAASAAEECRALVIAGQPIDEPIARYGPFVMNTREEIMQAFEDFQSGRLGEIAGREERMAKTDAARRTQHATGRWAKDEL